MNTMTRENGVRELTVDELDLVSGGDYGRLAPVLIATANAFMHPPPAPYFLPGGGRNQANQGAI